MGFFTNSRDLYESKAASGITSEVHRVSDADEITVFVRGSPSTTTLQGSNADGRTKDITNTTDDWSVLTTVVPGSVTSPAMINIEPGFGYIRAQRSETSEVRIQLKNRTR